MRVKALLAALVALTLIAPNSGFAATVSDLPEPLVKVIPGSEINLVSRESSIPVVVQNDFDVDIRVQVNVRPTFPRVLVESPVLIEVPANTSVTAQVPVKAVANGDVGLVVWLTSFTGVRLTDNVLLEMNVQADLEAAVLIGFSSVVAILIAIGAWRTVHRRRKRVSR